MTAVCAFRPKTRVASVRILPSGRRSNRVWKYVLTARRGMDALGSVRKLPPVRRPSEVHRLYL